jgi:predicted HTH domain antitoxin
VESEIAVASPATLLKLTPEMSTQITIDLPEGAFSALRQSKAEFAAELRLAAAVKWYEMGKFSQEKAAELAGLSRAEFISALERFRVSPFQVEPRELAHELGSP